MIRNSVAALAVTSVLFLGCNDKAAPTQPLFFSPTPAPSPVQTPVPTQTNPTPPAPTLTPRQTPVPTRTPFQTPTPVPQAISVTLDLQRLAPPPGARHAALATVRVQEAEGRTVSLTRIEVYNYAGADLAVSGFTPMRLGPGEATTYVLTLTSTVDVPCAEELFFEVDFEGGTSGKELNCSTGPWFF